MSDRLTTVASYDTVAKAEAARAALEAAGIRAALTDGEIVALGFLNWSPLGGTYLQVAEADADRAAAVLADALGDEAGLVSEGINEDELTRQALAEPPEEGEEPADDEDEDG
jgi:hypothetical protein